MNADETFGQVATFTEALTRCVSLAGIAPKAMADRLGLSYGHYVRMMRPGDPMNFPPDRIFNLMREAGNMLPLEWLAWKMGYRLHEKSLGEVLAVISAAMVELGADAPKFVFCDNGRIVPA